MNILVADDHAIVRTGIKHVLEEYPNVEKVFEAVNGEEALKIFNENNLSLVLLDISMPLLSGLEVLQKINKSKNKCPVLMLSMYPEKEYAIRAFKYGAHGYISKESAPDELSTAIDYVLSGNKYISKNMQNVLIEFNTDKSKYLKHELLSKREFNVLIQLAEGRSLQEIADKLFLSIKTVSTYKSRLMQKLEIKTLPELTKYAINHKLIEM